VPPGAWPRGEVTGLLARGPVTVRRLAWTPERIAVVLTAPADRSVRLELPGGRRFRVALTAGRPYRLRTRR
jgi:hypothetical protein